MANHHMVVVNGVRYRAEDAERLGLVPAPPSEPPKKKTAKKAAARHKARRPAKEPTRGDDDGS